MNTLLRYSNKETKKYRRGGGGITSWGDLTTGVLFLLANWWVYTKVSLKPGNSQLGKQSRVNLTLLWLNCSWSLVQIARQNYAITIHVCTTHLLPGLSLVCYELCLFLQVRDWGKRDRVAITVFCVTLRAPKLLETELTASWSRGKERTGAGPRGRPLRGRGGKRVTILMRW